MKGEYEMDNNNLNELAKLLSNMLGENEPSDDELEEMDDCDKWFELYDELHNLKDCLENLGFEVE